MTGNEIMAFIGKAVTAVGGVSVIAACVCRIMEKRMEQRFDAKLKKELEKYKAEIGKKQYVSKTRFDAEFELYKELSEAFFDLMKDLEMIVTSENNFFESYARTNVLASFYVKFEESNIKAMKLLYRNVPFISETIFDKYDEILKLVMNLFDGYIAIFIMNDHEITRKEHEAFRDEENKTYEMIVKELDMLNGELREYLKNLEVM